ncbi:MAG: GDSL-type esterase/lipase family protein [Pirellulales bacterium]
MNAKNRRKFRWWHKLLGVALSLTLCGFALEATLRVAGVSTPTATVLGTFFQYDPQTGWSGRPNASAQFQTASFSALTTHDADGLRRCGLPSRIVDDGSRAERMCWVLGDSTTWGWGVKDDEHFVALLNQSSPPNVRYRNLGVPGFSTIQQYHRLAALLERGYRPDAVVVCFNNNDHSDNQMLVDPDPPRPYARVEEEKVRFFDPPVGRSFELEVGSFLRRHSLSVSFVSYHLQRVRAARRMAKMAQRESSRDTREPRRDDEATTQRTEAERRSPVDDAPPQAELVYRESLQRLQQLCERERIELAVATEFAADPKVLDACRDLGVRVFDMSRPYRRRLDSSDGGETLYFAYDPHINAAGHRLFASALQDELRAWLPDWHSDAPRIRLARP